MCRDHAQADSVIIPVFNSDASFYQLHVTCAIHLHSALMLNIHAVMSSKVCGC